MTERVFDRSMNIGLDVIVENVMDIVWALDLQLRFKYVNAAITRIAGYSVQEALQMKLSDVLPESAIQDIMAILKERVESREPRPQIMETQLKHRNGSLVHIETLAIFVRDKEMMPVGIVGIARDITQRKIIEQKLRQQSQLNEVLLDSLPYPSMLIDKNMIIMAANLPALQAGARLREHCGQVFGSRFCPDNEANLNLITREKSANSLCPHCLAPAALQTQTAMKSHDIEIHGRVWEAHWRPLNSEMFLHYAIDVTERRQCEEQSRRAAQIESIAAMAGSIAHDLNNKLVPVVAGIDLLIFETGMSSTMRRDLLRIKNHCVDVAEEVRDLLILARHSYTGKALVDIKKVITASVNGLTENNPRRVNQNINIRIKYPEQPLMVNGSRFHLNKVFQNLLSNAIEAMPHGGEIQIIVQAVEVADPAVEARYLPAGRYVKIAVKDTGAGIPPENISHIFEPFFTSKIPGERSGSGLGLAVVDNVIKQHHGHVDVKSEINLGSTFTCYLPLLESAPMSQPGKEELSEAIEHGHDSILFIDDEELQRRFGRKILEKLGYYVVTACNGRQGVKIFDQFLADGNGFDLVVCDMVMETDFDGIETCLAIRKLRPNQKFIIVSGFSSNERIKSALRIGVDDFIGKPYTIQEISAAVRRVLEADQIWPD